MGSCSEERDLRVLVDKQLNKSKECAAATKKANRMLGCSNKGSTSRDKKKSSSQCATGRTGNAVFGFGSSYAKTDVGRGRLERVQSRATKMIKGLTWKPAM